MSLIKLSRAALFALVASLLMFAQAAQATNYTLWIHGANKDWAEKTKDGTDVEEYTFNYYPWSFYSPAKGRGVNAKMVKWDGKNHVSESDDRISRALDCFCTGKNWCYIATHSTGNMMIGRQLALRGSTTRIIRNAEKASGGGIDGVGSCQYTTGGASNTQKGWNIKSVRNAAGAAGGSEAADKWCSECFGGPIAWDLVTTTARASYDHNNTRGVPFFMYMGAVGQTLGFENAGDNDTVISFHSAGGVSGTAGTPVCLPGTSVSPCAVMTMGTSPIQARGSAPAKAKWAMHSVVFIDPNREHNHGSHLTWGGDGWDYDENRKWGKLYPASPMLIDIQRFSR